MRSSIADSKSDNAIVAATTGERICTCCALFLCSLLVSEIHSRELIRDSLLQKLTKGNVMYKRGQQ